MQDTYALCNLHASEPSSPSSAHLDDVAVAQPPEAVDLVVKGAQLRQGGAQGPDLLHSHLIHAVLERLMDGCVIEDEQACVN